MTDKPKPGRPPAPPHLKRVDIPLRLPQWLADWLDAQAAPRADTIEAALMKAHKLRAPARKE